MPLLLDLAGISKTFGDFIAVNQVSFQINEGEIFGLLGPNGAGKTTLIRTIVGIYEPDQGQVRFKGGQDRQASRRKISYLPEERGLYENDKLLACLIFFGRLHGMTQEACLQRATELCERFQMTVHSDKKIKTLSKGNQQKVQLMSALMQKPELLILDEPFSGMDPLNIQLVTEVLRELRAAGVGILLSTHQMNHAEQFCDRIALVNKGRLLLCDRLSALIDRHSGRLFQIHADQIEAESLFHSIQKLEDSFLAELSEGYQPRDLFRWAGSREGIRSVKPYRRPLQEIFISEVAAHV